MANESNKELTSVWTPANIVTCVRIVFIPVFMIVSALSHTSVAGTDWSTFDGPLAAAAFILYVILSCTDKVDGYLARSRNEITDFGKFMDPLADKCLVMAALCWFVETGDMVGWVLAAVLLREFAVSGMRLIAVEKGRVIAAGWSGKVKTASTMVCICLILFGIPHWLNLACQGVILVTTVYSGVEYFVKNWDVFSEK